MEQTFSPQSSSINGSINFVGHILFQGKIKNLKENLKSIKQENFWFSIWKFLQKSRQFQDLTVQKELPKIFKPF